LQDKGQIFPLLALCYLSNTLLYNLKPFAMAGSMARLRHCTLNRRDLAHVGSELPVIQAQFAKAAHISGWPTLGQVDVTSHSQ
jgi:hypothetical protein